MSYNVIINSENNLNASSNPNRASLNYYVDWSSVFKNQPIEQQYIMTCTFTGSSNTIQGNYTYLLYMSGLSSNQYIVSTNGANSTTAIGALKYGSNLSTSSPAYLSTDMKSNPPIYLLSRPNSNNFNIEIRNTVNNNLFSDDSIAGAGTATLAATTLTIVTQTAGTLYIGSIVTISAVNYKILNYGTANGATGTYIVDTSGTIATATAYTTSGRQELTPYSLILNFTPVN